MFLENTCRRYDKKILFFFQYCVDNNLINYLFFNLINYFFHKNVFFYLDIFYLFEEK